MKTYKIEITFKVSDNWIEDGFDLKERIQDIVEFFKGMLPYAYDHETSVKVNVKESK